MLGVKHPVALVAVFTWLGLVVGIAFITSWLKYRAFGVTLPVGASIDMKLLPALIRVEWVLAIAVLVDIFLGRSSIPMFALMAVPLLLLAFQTFWLQQAMDAQALLIFHGQGTTDTHLGTTNIIAEADYICVKTSAG